MNTKITLIIFALFALVIICSQNFLIQPVYAIEVSSKANGDMSGSFLSAYSSTYNKYILNAGGGIRVVDPNTHDITSYSLGSAGAGKTWGLGIYCSGSTCYVVRAGGSLPDYVRAFDALTGTTIHEYSFDVSGADVNISGMTGLVTSGSGIINGWVVVGCSVGLNLAKIDGTHVGTCGGTIVGVTSVLDIVDFGDTGKVVVSGTSASNSIEIWTISTNSRCVITNSLTTGGAMDYYNNAVYIVKSTTTILKYDSSCVSGTGISGHGITSQITAIDSIPADDVFLVQGTTTTAFMNLSSSNISTLAYTVSLGFTDTATTIRNRYNSYSTTEDQVLKVVDTSTTTDQLVFIDLQVSEGEENEEEAFCSQPENENLLTCRLANQNGELSSFSDLVGGTFGNSTNNLFVQLGLVEEGSDIKTNGVGYAFIVVGIGLMTAILYLASGGDLHRIPTFVWFLGSLSVVGGLAGFDFIDPVFFIIAILVVIALASGKILSTLEIGGFR